MNDKMEIMNGGKALMKALEKEGVKEVFGLPGGANLPMYDELFKSNIRHILVRHEQSAAHMADGFGRVSRKPGVCFATSGPGANKFVNWNCNSTGRFCTNGCCYWSGSGKHDWS